MYDTVKGSDWLGKSVPGCTLSLMFAVIDSGVRLASTFLGFPGLVVGCYFDDCAFCGSCALPGDQDAIQYMCREAPKAVIELENYGLRSHVLKMARSISVLLVGRV